MTKKDLKVGMVCEIDYNGETSLCMILPSKTTDKCLSGKNQWCPLERFNDDLVNGSGLRINKVYDICGCNMAAHELGTFGRKLLWERPKYYNGKVVCIDNSINTHIYTIGKIYEFKDGCLTGDNGWKYPEYVPVKSFKEWSNWTSSKFIEVVE